METKAEVARWQRWHSGRVVLHLSSGAVLFFDGSVRTKETPTLVVDYEVRSETYVMIPAFVDVLAIEVR